MELTFRKKQLLEWMSAQSGYVSISRIAKQFGISERTVRYELDQLESFIEPYGMQLLRVPSKGILLNNCEHLPKVLSAVQLYFPGDTRKQHMLAILFVSPYCSLSNFLEHFRVSRQTIYKDIAKLRQVCTEKKLFIKSVRSKGFALLGNEKDIRNVFIEQLSFEEFTHAIWALLPEATTLEQIMLAHCADHTIRLIRYTPREVELYFRFVQARVSMGASLPPSEPAPEPQERDLPSSIETYICEQLPALDALDFLSFLSDNMEFVSCNAIHSRADQETVMHIVNDLLSAFGFIWDDGNDIFDMLYNHIWGMFIRLKRNQESQNPMTSEIQISYPLFYEMVQNVLYRHKNKGICFSADEVAYITLYMNSIYENTVLKRPNIRIALLCNAGTSTSRILLRRLAETFSHILARVISLDEMKRHHHDYDLVISTIPYTGENVIHVHPLLRKEDIQNIDQKLAQLRYFKQCNLLIHQYEDAEKIHHMKMRDLLPEDCIQLDLDERDWKKAIHVAAQPLLNNRVIVSKYIASCIEGIEQFGNYSVVLPKVAFVHASPKDGVYKKGISFLRLKHSIAFGRDLQSTVKGIFVLATTEREDIGILKLINILDQPNNMDTLLDSGSKKRIQDMENRYGK